MTTVSPVQCFACTRLIQTVDESTDTQTVARCRAYPDGIPMEIGMLGADHRTARGDETRGLIFERATGTAADQAWKDWQRKAAAMR